MLSLRVCVPDFLLSTSLDDCDTLCRARVLKDCVGERSDDSDRATRAWELLVGKADYWVSIAADERITIKHTSRLSLTSCQP